MPSASGGRGSVPWTYAGSSAPDPPYGLVLPRSPWRPTLLLPQLQTTSDALPPLDGVCTQVLPSFAASTDPNRCLPRLHTRISLLHLFCTFIQRNPTQTLVTRRSCRHGIEYEDTWHDFVHAILPEIDFFTFFTLFFVLSCLFSFRAVD